MELSSYLSRFRSTWCFSRISLGYTWSDETYVQVSLICLWLSNKLDLWCFTEDGRRRTLRPRAMGEFLREKMTVASGALVGMMLLVILQLLQLSAAEDCGRQAGGKTCPNNLCCSQYGWCGSTSDYCGNGCQSQCGGGGGGGGGSTGKASYYTAPYVRKFPTPARLVVHLQPIAWTWACNRFGGPSFGGALPQTWSRFAFWGLIFNFRFDLEN